MRAERCVRAVNSAARLRRATNANVPLHELLDVEIDESNDGTTGVLSHEASMSARLYKPSLSGGAFRVDKSASKDLRTTHAAPPSMTSFSCDQSPPFVLARFQDFLFGLSPSVVRGKGALFFVEDANNSENKKRYAFNLSGNGRHIDVEIERMDNEADRTVHLAFIGGNDLDVSALEQELAACSTPQDPNNTPIHPVPSELLSDERFDTQLIDDGKGNLLFLCTLMIYFNSILSSPM